MRYLSTFYCVYTCCQHLYQAVLHLSLVSIILLLLQKCTSLHLYLSTASKNFIGEIFVYILRRLYLLLASVSSVLHLSLVSIILLLLQKCTSSHLYLSTASKNFIGEIFVYILLRLYLLLASVSSVLHLSLVSIILLLLQKCTCSHLYLSTASKNCIGEIFVYILLRLYLLLASVSSCTASIIGIDHLASPAKVYMFTPVLINCFKELYW